MWLVGTLAGMQLLVAGMTAVTVAGAARRRDSNWRRDIELNRPIALILGSAL